VEGSPGINDPEAVIAVYEKTLLCLECSVVFKGVGGPDGREKTVLFGKKAGKGVVVKGSGRICVKISKVLL
jgi:hypothetical protein